MSSLLRVVQSVSLKLAQQALTAALDEAERLGLSVSIAIVGAAGEVILAAHMDEAPLPCRSIAMNKAMTAAGFRSSTADWASRLEACSSMVRQGLPLQAGLALFGGGEPFIYNGVRIGAVGVSGASEANDIACARAACERLESLLQPSLDQTLGV